MVVGVGGVWGLHSHFHVQPNYSVEVVLCCVVIRVVTNINLNSLILVCTVCFILKAYFTLVMKMMG